MTTKADVVTSDIPRPLYLEAMKKDWVKFDLVNDSGEIFGKHILINHNESKHGCTLLNKDVFSTGTVWEADICRMDNATCYKTFSNPHNYLAHLQLQS